MKIAFTAIRLLTFRCTQKELRGLNYRHLAFGLFCTWLVGMGRWWEDPKAGVLQHLGIGSVIYVFLLGLFLWLVLWPLTPPHWSFLNVLIFVTLTAPPAILYAIPVRHGLPVQTAQMVRLWFLAVVAGWRVALLGFYLRRGAGLSASRSVLALLFPLLLIVFALTALNLEKVVFDFMGGIHESDRSVNDAAYGVLVLICMFAALAFVPLLGAYLLCSVNCVTAKYGRRCALFLYLLALALALSGVGLIFLDMMVPGAVCVGSGIVVTVATMISLHERRNQ